MQKLNRYFLPAYCATSSFFFGMYGLSIGEFVGHPPFSSFMFGVFALIAVSSVVLSSMHSQTTKDEQIANQVTHHESLSDLADLAGGDDDNIRGQPSRKRMQAFQRLHDVIDTFDSGHLIDLTNVFDVIYSF